MDAFQKKNAILMHLMEWDLLILKKLMKKPFTMVVIMINYLDFRVLELNIIKMDQVIYGYYQRDFSMREYYKEFVDL